MKNTFEQAEALPQSLLNLQIKLKDGSVSVAELANRFYNSEYGQEMLSQPLRFSVDYGYDRQQSLEDQGYDLCPVGHQRESVAFLEQILKSEHRNQTLFDIGPEDKATVAFALSIHDIGESMHDKVAAAHGGRVLGDLPAGTKTDDDRALEASIRQFLYGEVYPDVDPGVLGRIEAIIAHKDDTLLHDLYEAAHHLQSLDTVERAEARLLAIEPVFGPLDQRTTALYGMSRIVRPTVVASLDKYRYFAAIDTTLAAQPDDHYEHIVTVDNASYHQNCTSYECRLAVVTATMSDTTRLAA